jgi:hypothetical protein
MRKQKAEDCARPVSTTPAADVADWPLEIHKVDDAIEIVKMAGLYCNWFPAGSGRGFAGWLYSNRQPANPSALDDERAAYLADCFEGRRLGEDLDADLRARIQGWLKLEARDLRYYEGVAAALKRARQSAGGMRAMYVFAQLAKSEGRHFGRYNLTASSLQALNKLLLTLYALREPYRYYGRVDPDAAYPKRETVPTNDFFRLEQLLRKWHGGRFESVPIVVLLTSALAANTQAHRRVAMKLASLQTTTCTPASRP